MSQVFLRRLRISLATLLFINGCILIGHYIYYQVNFGKYDSIYLDWTDTTRIVLLIMTFIVYVYAVRGHRLVHRFVRAFLLFGIAIVLLYIHLNEVIERNNIGISYACEDLDYFCGTRRAIEFIFIVIGFLMVLEIGVTLRRGPEEETNQGPKEVVIVSPLQPIHQNYQVPYYPSLQGQHQQPAPLIYQESSQYSSSPKYEVQGSITQQYQQPHQSYYQPQPTLMPQYQQYYQQQQLQYPYATVSYNATPPQVPGSMVTATPQPGAQPIANHPSPGFSMAVSPVLPTEGVLTPPAGRSSTHETHH